MLLEGKPHRLSAILAFSLLLLMTLHMWKRSKRADSRKWSASSLSEKGSPLSSRRQLLFFLFLCAFFLRGMLPGFFGSDYQLVLDQTVSAVGKVQSVTEKSVRLTEVSVLEGRVWKRVKNPVYIKKEAGCAYDPGDWAGLSGRVTAIDPIIYISVLYPFGAFHYPYRAGPITQLLSFGQTIAAAYAEHVRRILPPEEAMVASGIFLGKRFEGDLRVSMNDSGLGHLFVVSGLHFAMLFQIGLILIGLFRIGDPFRTFMILGFLFLFWILTGCPASSSRAFFLILFYSLFRMFSYPASPLNLLGAAAILLLLFQPSYAQDIGFSLSFLATVGLYCGHRFSLRAGGKMSRYLLPLTGAMVFTTPITIAQFGRMPFLSMLFNLLFVSVVATVLMIGLLASFVCFLLNLHGLSAIFLNGLTPLLKLNTAVLYWLGRNGGTLAVPPELSIPFWVLAAAFFFTALSVKEPVRSIKT